MSEQGCECWMTDPSTWLSAASCGYGSGYEPGSQWEWNPDCPVHRPFESSRPADEIKAEVDDLWDFLKPGNA